MAPAKTTSSARQPRVHPGLAKVMPPVNTCVPTVGNGSPLIDEPQVGQTLASLVAKRPQTPQTSMATGRRERPGYTLMSISVGALAGFSVFGRLVGGGVVVLWLVRWVLVCGLTVCVECG